MATEQQINANRQNSQYSTGPRTHEGKAVASRNALTLGLYTREDYVKPEERDLYKEFCGTMYSELAPDSLLEQSLTAEITGATWRLRRCSAVEADLADYALARDDATAKPYRHEGASQHIASRQDPLLDEKSEKIQRSIERARSHSHSLLHRSINQLRKLQTDRLTREELLNPGPVPAWAGIADYKSISAAVNALHRGNKKALPPHPALAQLQSIMSDPGISPELEAELIAEAMEKERIWKEEHETESVGSNCNPAEAPEEEAVIEPEGHAATAESALIPRNTPCPCGSREKYKRCCGKNAPAVLHKGAKLAA